MHLGYLGLVLDSYSSYSCPFYVVHVAPRDSIDSEVVTPTKLDSGLPVDCIFLDVVTG